MPVLSQYNFIFGIGTAFGFLDAWNIGANDVSNSFATSVAAKALTMTKAMGIAAVMEFSGAVGAGLRSYSWAIISVEDFKENPAILMSVMTYAVVSSSISVTVMTKLGLPVSSTQTLIGGVIGAGWAALGSEKVTWGWKGVARIFICWVISPLLAGAFSSAIFGFTKFYVMRPDGLALQRALTTAPFYYAVTAAVITMLVVWGGVASDKGAISSWGAGEYCGVIFGVGAGLGLVARLFLVPYLYRKLELDDWQLKWYHVFQGPFLYGRGRVPENPNPVRESGTEEDGSESTVSHRAADKEANADIEAKEADALTTPTCPGCGQRPAAPTESRESGASTSTGKWYMPKRIFLKGKELFFRGVNIDMVEEQKKSHFLGRDVGKMHENNTPFDPKAEEVYRYLLILTAAVSSFAHGANDISNAVGLLSTIYLIWKSGEVPSSSDTPIWILVSAAAALVVGPWTYGWRVMVNLGNRLTLMTPCRGVAVQLGSSITVAIATRLSLPVSTTQCMLGAAFFFGLCDNRKAVNWKLCLGIYVAWFIVLPCTALLAYCIAALAFHTAQW